MTRKQYPQAGGNRLREARLSLGLSQYDVSNETGITQCSLFLYEVGKVVPNLRTAKKLAKFYQIPLEELFELTIAIKRTKARTED